MSALETWSSPPEGTRPGRGWVVVVAACLILSLGMIVLSFRALSTERSYAVLMAQIDRRVHTCPPPKRSPVPPDNETDDPPQDTMDSTVPFPKGRSLSLETSLSNLAGENQPFVTLGDVLPRDRIALVNLWAPWCGPCNDEFPVLQKFFSARSDVAFVPVLLSTDMPDPKDYVSKMPRFEVFLSDYRGDLERELKDRQLYRDELPVTFLVGCRRKVRWAHFGRLTEKDLISIENELNALNAELGTEACAPPLPPLTGPAECRNGVCEQAEGRDTCCWDCCPGDDGVCDLGENQQSRDCKKANNEVNQLGTRAGGSGKPKSTKYDDPEKSAGGKRKNGK